MLAQCLDSFETAAAGGYEVFHDNDFCSGLQFAFNEVLHTVVFRFAAYVCERQRQLVCHECTLGYGSRGYTGHGLCLGKVFLYGVAKLELHEITQLRKRQCLAVVAIERRLPSGSPCERIARLQFYGFHLEQF